MPSRACVCNEPEHLGSRRRAAKPGSSARASYDEHSTSVSASSSDDSNHSRPRPVEFAEATAWSAVALFGMFACLLFIIPIDSGAGLLLVAVQYVIFHAFRRLLGRTRRLAKAVVVLTIAGMVLVMVISFYAAITPRT